MRRPIVSRLRDSISGNRLRRTALAVMAGALACAPMVLRAEEPGQGGREDQGAFQNEDTLIPIGGGRREGRGPIIPLLPLDRRRKLQEKEGWERIIDAFWGQKERVESADDYSKLPRNMSPTRVGGNVWVAQGPGPIEFGQVEGMTAQNDPVVGAIQALQTHPTNADIIWVGAVNGGIWKTTNATAATPTWSAKTDAQQSLSMFCIELDPTDSTNNTLWAGIGRNSSLGRVGTRRLGLLRSTDGGENWTLVDGSGVLTGKNISGVAARGSTIVVSVNIADSFTFSNIGIFRSTNGGTTFTQVSGASGSGLPSGNCYDLASDPSNNAVLYAPVINAGASNGIYKSTDTGATWTRVSNATINALTLDSSSNIEIVVGTANNVFVGIVNSGRLAGVFRSGDGGSTWTQLDLPVTTEGATSQGLHPEEQDEDSFGDMLPMLTPGGQGSIHFSLAADPVNSNILYLGGDRQPLSAGSTTGTFPNSIGANNFSGRLFRLDAGLPSGSQAISLTHNPSTVQNSSPHADSRSMAFDAAGDLIEVDDGGIYRRTLPRANNGDWSSLNGSITTTEFHSIEYDNLGNVFIGGAQDCGSAEQVSAGSATWSQISQGDGGVVAVDNITGAGVGRSVRFSSFQFFQAFRWIEYDATNTITAGPVFPDLIVNGTGSQTLAAVDTGIQFYQPIFLNRLNPLRAVLGTASLYETADRFETLDNRGALGGTFICAAYGGTSGGVPNEDVLWVGTNASAASQRLQLRTSGTGAPSALAAYTFGSVRDIVLRPSDWQTAYVIDQDQVIRTVNAGTSFTDISGNIGTLMNLTSVTPLRSIEYMPGPGAVDALLVGGPGGVFVMYTNNVGVWDELGTNLPNGLAYDVHYDATDDLIGVSVLGRGVFSIPAATNVLFPGARVEEWRGY